MLPGAGGYRRVSATGDAVAVRGFDDEPSGGQGSEALIEGGGADAAAGAQFGERRGLPAVRESSGDPRSGSWVIASTGRIGGIGRHEHRTERSGGSPDG